MLEAGHLLLFGVPAWLAVFAILTCIHVAVTYLLKTRSWAESPLAKDPVLAGHFLPQVRDLG